MNLHKRVVAIVPAAGIGKRFGPGIIKQFMTLSGKPVLIWSLAVLESMEEISEIIPVVTDEYMGYCADLVEEYCLSKVRRIAPGGRERQDSVLNGLKLVEDTESPVLVHDGVRPLIEPAHIKDAINALENSDGAVVGVPVKDTIKEAEDNIVVKTLNRSSLWAVQTPQVFRYPVLYTACLRALEENFRATDESGLVEHYGGTVRMVQGSYMNIKVTTPEDLHIAELFISMRGKTG